jgi:hydroxymethylglutaryl-CoA lyase/(R)-citramalyl-CoA lyase
MTVEVCDVGPRDGLQNEAVVLSPEVRADFVNLLALAGLRRVEVTSFVSSQRVPQMANAEDVCAAVVPNQQRTTYAGLVLNTRGYDRLAGTLCTEARAAFCVTETFNQRNQGRTVAESVSAAVEVIRSAHRDGRRASVTLAASFGCPFEGRVSSATVLALAERMAAAGADELVFADTIGVGTPRQVKTLLGGARDLGLPLGLHLHNTRNTGYANAYAALDHEVDVLDSALGGIGGCPFAPNATGNIATEDLLNLLEGEGIDTGIDLDSVLRVSEWLTKTLNRDLPGQLYRAGRFPGSLAKGRGEQAGAGSAFPG